MYKAATHLAKWKGQQHRWHWDSGLCCRPVHYENPCTDTITSRHVCLKLPLCTQGHFQIMFNKANCPLNQPRLSFFMKMLYISGVWSYIVGAISTPTFIIIPIITIWFGVFPIVVSFWAALGLTVYYIATQRCSPSAPSTPLYTTTVSASLSQNTAPLM